MTISYPGTSDRTHLALSIVSVSTQPLSHGDLYRFKLTDPARKCPCSPGKFPSLFFKIPFAELIMHLYYFRCVSSPSGCRGGKRRFYLLQGKFMAEKNYFSKDFFVTINSVRIANKGYKGQRLKL